MLFSAGVVVIIFGFLCIFNTELIWLLYELDARVFSNKQLVKTQKKLNAIMYQGAGMIVLGSVGVMVSLNLI